NLPSAAATRASYYARVRSGRFLASRRRPDRSSAAGHPHRRRGRPDPGAPGWLARVLVTCRHPTSRAGRAPAVEPDALLTAASRTHLPPGVPMTGLARRTLLWLAAIAIAAGCGSTNRPRISVDPPSPVPYPQRLRGPDA